MEAFLSPERQSHISGQTMEHAPVKKEEIPLSGEVLLVFGQGPVIDAQTRLPAQRATAKGNEDLNFWSKDLALAASLLYHAKAVNRLVLLGGKTGGRQYKSEAELMAEYLQAANVPREAMSLDQEIILYRG